MLVADHITSRQQLNYPVCIFIYLGLICILAWNNMVTWCTKELT